MGCFVNPPSGDKETWLNANGVFTGKVPGPITDTHKPVCLVDNGMFYAAGVAYSARELEAFNSPSDPRERVWFNVPVDKLLEVSDLHAYL